MTQFDATMSEDDDDVQDPNDPADLRRKLRDALKSNKELNAKVTEAGALQKENAFLKAGLPDTPQVRFFQEHYAGDATTEAIKAAAAQFGFISEGDSQAQMEAAEIEAQAAAMAGSTSSMAPDSQEAMMKEFADVVARGGNGEAVLRKYGHHVASDDR